MKRTNGRSTKHDAGAHGAYRAVYYLKLSVSNVLCFGDQPQTLDLSDETGRPAPWTVLLGNNGTGKTTLLQCMTAFFGPAQRNQIDQEIWTHRFLMRWVEKQWTPYRDSAQSPSRIEAELANGFGFGHKKQYEVKRGKFEFFRRSISSTAVFDVPIAFAYGAGRRLSGSALSGDVVNDPTESLFSDESPLRNAEEWLLQADYRALKSGKSADKDQVSHVRDVLKNILPEVTDIRISQPEQRRKRAIVEFKMPYGWVALRRMSYGYRTLIAWMVDFASRMFEAYPDSDDPLNEPAVVLVDEIDLHLHPTWQRQLMSYLSERFANTQFIVTAHSPLIVQAAPSVNANIAVLRRDGDHVVIDNTKASVDGWRLDQILTSELFGLPSARAAEYDEALNRRVKLLSKPNLSSAQKKELAKLDKQLEHLPAGETAAQAQEMLDLAKSTMELLNKHKGRRE